MEKQSLPVDNSNLENIQENLTNQKTHRRKGTPRKCVRFRNDNFESMNPQPATLQRLTTTAQVQKESQLNESQASTSSTNANMLQDTPLFGSQKRRGKKIPVRFRNVNLDSMEPQPGSLRNPVAAPQAHKEASPQVQNTLTLKSSSSSKLGPTDQSLTEKLDNDNLESMGPQPATLHSSIIAPQKGLQSDEALALSSNFVIITALLPRMLPEMLERSPQVQNTLTQESSTSKLGTTDQSLTEKLGNDNWDWVEPQARTLHSSVTAPHAQKESQSDESRASNFKRFTIEALVQKTHPVMLESSSQVQNLSSQESSISCKSGPSEELLSEKSVQAFSKLVEKIEEVTQTPRTSNVASLVDLTKEEIDDSGVLTVKPIPVLVLKCEDKIYFVCESCEIRFSHKSFLISHNVNVHKIITYSCGICFLRFADEKQLMIHQTWHDKFTSYYCFNCRKIFYLRNEYFSHQDECYCKIGPQRYIFEEGKKILMFRNY